MRLGTDDVRGRVRGRSWRWRDGHGGGEGLELGIEGDGWSARVISCSMHARAQACISYARYSEEIADVEVRENEEQELIAQGLEERRLRGSHVCGVLWHCGRR